MKGRALGILFGLCYLSALGQSSLDVVSENLLFINQEFAKYNPYNTIFRIDRTKKTMVWYNDYGEREGNLYDLEFRVTTEKYLGVYCIDGSNCIIQDRGSSSNTTDYDMTFKDDSGNFPSSGYQIIEKFNEIKRALNITVRGGSSSSSSYTGGAASTGIDYGKIRDNLNYINGKFSTYNAYETSFDVNTTTGVLTLRDKFGYMKAPISELDFLADYSNNLFEVSTKSGEECMIYYSTSGYRQGSHYSSYTMGLNYNNVLIYDARTVVTKLEEIRAMYSYGSSAYINAGLNYANEIFSYYNQYNTRFSVEMSSKMMVCSDSFRIMKSPATSTEYRTSTYFGIYCKSSDYCLQHYNIYGTRGTDDKTSYTMNLSYNDSLVPEAAVIARLLNNIARMVASGSSSTSSNAGTDIDAKLRFINGEYAKYNSYNTVYSFDSYYKTVSWSNEFGVHTAALANVEFRSNPSGNNIGVYCYNATECINYAGYTDGNSTYNEYTQTFSNNGSTPSTMEQVVAAMKEIQSTILYGGTGTNSTSYGTTLSERLRKVNDLYSSNAKTSGTWTVNEATKQLICKSGSCTHTLNLNEITSISYSYTSSAHNLVFMSESKGINRNCGSSLYEGQSIHAMNSRDIAEQLTTEFLAIKALVLQ